MNLHSPSDSESRRNRELDDLVDRLVTKLEAGESADVDELARDYPAHIEPLRRLLPTLQAIARLEVSNGTLGSNAPPSSSATRTLGDYRIIREAGRGGMGVVYEAEQISLGRRVALKVLPFASAVDERQLQRFKNEAMAAAQLDHPHIVDVYGVGSDRSIHFYAMRYIEGHTLAEWIRQLRSARAIPHDDGVAGVNSPLQPDTTGMDRTIDLAPVPGREFPDQFPQSAASAGQADPATGAETGPIAELSTQRPRDTKRWFEWVAKVGVQVAEALHYAHQRGIIHRDVKPSNLIVDRQKHVWITDFGLAQIEAAPALTRTDDVLGTLRYMSPEQASGRSGAVNHRTDIYSLGVTLYELLTLETPFADADRGGLIRKINGEEPRPLRNLNPSIPVDLETIVMKAIARLPEERYASSADLASDLQRFLERRPIQARRAGLFGKAGKWVRRHPALVGTTAAVATAMVVALSLSNVLVSQALDLAEQQRQAAVQQRDAASDHLYVAHMRLAVQDWESGQIRRMRESLAAHIPASGQLDRRGWEWRFLSRLATQQSSTLRGHADKIRTLAANPEGTLLASGSEDHSVRLWDVATRREILRLSGRHDSHVFSVAWCPLGEKLASADKRGRILIWNVQRGEVIQNFDYPRQIMGLTWSPDGQRLAAGNERGHVRIWDAETGVVVRNLDGNVGMIRALAWSRTENDWRSERTIGVGFRSGMWGRVSWRKAGGLMAMWWQESRGIPTGRGWLR